MPSIKYKGHPHLLYVVVHMRGCKTCQACDEELKGTVALLCGDQECNFRLHVRCGPLPRTIKHACHVHPLTLQDYYAEDNATDEFACHVCEEKRDPRLRVYSCSRGCFMICDLSCTISEVTSLLRGEHGEVELMTPFPRVACRVINSKSSIFEEMISETNGAKVGFQKTKYVFSIHMLRDSSLDYEGFEEEETFGLEMLEEENKTDDKLKTENEKGDEVHEETAVQIHKAETSSTSEESTTCLDDEVERYLFSWKALAHFKNSIHILSRYQLKDDFLELYDGSFVTGDFALPEILGPIYEQFFGMYNIGEDKCNINYSQKRHLILITCGVLHQMRMTKVVDVTKYTILQWFGWIRYVEENGGFNFGFVVENIKQVWRVHYYIKSKKIVDKKSSQLREDVERKTERVEELRTLLAEAEARLEEAPREENEHEIYRVIGSRGPMKKEKKDALEI